MARRIIVLCVALAACDASASAALAPAETTARAGDEACTMVELFTSQGCSSCPPADTLLDALVAEHGDRIAPLAFHVDYWDELGWPDPFGSPRWSERQRAYAAAIGSNRVYTPQLMFDGRDRAVGVGRRRAEAALAEAARLPARAALRIDVQRDAASWRIAVEADATAPIEAEHVELFVALTEDGLETAVPHGENAGRTLRGNHVVRRLVRACAWSGKTSTRCEVTIDLAASWQHAALGVVVFAQDSTTMEIVGAAQSRPRA